MRFAEYAEKHGLNQKEPVETFDWMIDTIYVLDCKKALDQVEGSREWLKTYTYEELPFADEMGQTVIQKLHFRHSNEAAKSMLLAYKNVLNNWDTFVYETKKRAIVRSYRQETPMTDGEKEDLLVLQEEDMRLDIEREHRRLMESITFLYKHPYRWFDTMYGSTLYPGHPYQITKRAKAEMEEKFPGYTKHLEMILLDIGKK